MSKNYPKMATEIVEKVGGPENIEKMLHCMTRLRFVLKDESKAKKSEVERVEGVISVILAGGQFQVVIGTAVIKVYEAILQNYDLDRAVQGTSENSEVENQASEAKKNPFNMLIDTISGVFLPIIPGLGAVGILKGILVGLASLGVLSTESDTYIVLYALAQAFFYYLPVALTISSAERFKTNKFVALVVVLAMIYPDIIPGMGQNLVFDLFGFIPLKMIDYTSTVIPAIVVVWMIAKINIFFKRIIPKAIDMIMTPLCTILVAFPVSLLIVGPATYYTGVWMAEVYEWAFQLAPALACGILGLLWPLTIVFGLHWGFIPIAIQQISTFGYDTFSPITIASNFATMGACVAVFLKTRNKTMKEFAGGAAFSGITGGITEPGVYGITLKFKRPFVICCIFTCIGGIIMSFADAQFPGIMTASMITLPTLALLPGGKFTLFTCLLGFFGTGIATYFFGYSDEMLETEEKSA